MKMKKILTTLMLFGCLTSATAQDDLLDQLDVKTTVKENTPYAFKALQICNMQSTKLPVKGEWYVLISHRFGDLTNGLDNFFGLDEATTKIGGIYGVTNWLSLGLSRHRNNKTYEIAGKYKLANQKEAGFPVTIAGYNTVDIRTDKLSATYPTVTFSNRLAFSSQLLISRKFSENLSLEVAPIYVHKNLYDAISEQKDLFLVGAGGRYKLSKRLSVNLEYAARMNAKTTTTAAFQNPLSVGLDIETGGHVFQMVIANGQPMNDVGIFSNSSGKWDFKEGSGMYLGFNMYRVF
jgi:opacity protein-like surface antigen